MKLCNNQIAGNTVLFTLVIYTLQTSLGHWLVSIPEGINKSHSCSQEVQGLGKF